MDVFITRHLSKTIENRQNCYFKGVNYVMDFTVINTALELFSFYVYIFHNISLTKIKLSINHVRGWVTCQSANQKSHI